MNGRKAKARRKASTPNVTRLVTELRKESPQHRTSHPFGGYAEALGGHRRYRRSDVLAALEATGERP